MFLKENKILDIKNNPLIINKFFTIVGKIEKLAGRILFIVHNS